MGKNKSAIVKFGGGVIKLLPVSDTGSPVSGEQSAWIDFGYIQESKLSDVTDTEDINDETGNQIAVDEVKRIVKLSGLQMQSDKATLDFNKGTARGKFYSIYQYCGKVGGKHQEIYYGIGKLRPQVELASGTKRLPFEFSILKNDDALSFDPDTQDPGQVPYTPSGAYTTSAVNLAAEEYYKIVES